MKQILTIIIATLFTTLIHAQTKIKTPSTFDVVVSFGSICCGTASDDFLKTFIKKFNKTHKVKIPSYKASGCGKEGEYKIMFSTVKLKPALNKKFLCDLKFLTEKQDAKNKAKDSSSGTINLDYNAVLDDVRYCRGGIARWF